MGMIIFGIVVCLGFLFADKIITDDFANKIGEKIL
jgi:hypothetical protein